MGSNSRTVALENLNLAVLRVVNTRRCQEAFHPIDAWSPSDWSNAMAGECGETCNLTKKLLRGDAVPLEQIADEIADVIIYADLLAARMGIDLAAAVVRKFNIVSDRRGCAIKLRPTA